MESLDGDVELLLSQMAFFLADSPVLLAQIDQAVREQNSHQLQLAAHRLKGMLARYACREGADLAYALEQAGKNGELNEAADLAAPTGTARRTTDARRRGLRARARGSVNLAESRRFLLRKGHERTGSIDDRYCRESLARVIAVPRCGRCCTRSPNQANARKVHAWQNSRRPAMARRRRGRCMRRRIWERASKDSTGRAFWDLSGMANRRRRGSSHRGRPMGCASCGNANWGRATGSARSAVDATCSSIGGAASARVTCLAGGNRRADVGVCLSFGL